LTVCARVTIGENPIAANSVSKQKALLMKCMASWAPAHPNRCELEFSNPGFPK